MRTTSITTYLFLVAAMMALPIMLFLLLLYSELAASDRGALERRTAREARAVATAVQPVLLDMITTLKLLRTAPELMSGDLREFHARTREALKDSATFVITVDGEGTQLLNTRTEFGSPLGKMSDLAGLALAQSSNEIQISTVFFGRTSGKWVFNIIQPLAVSSETPARALIITKNAEELGFGMDPRALPPQWHSGLLDGNNNLIVSSEPTTFAPGKPVADLQSARFGASDAAVELGDFGSTGSMLGYAPVKNSQWHAVVWGPIASAQSSVLSSWRYLVFGGLAVVVVLGLAGYLAANQIRQAISQIATMADSLGRGEIVSPISSNIKEFDMISKAMSTASFERSEAEQQLHLLMRELVHRTKNLMAVILSMIRQTAKHSATVTEFQKSLEGRVHAMGHSIDLLTATDRSKVSLRELLERQLSAFAIDPDALTIRGDDLKLSPDAVQNLGLAFHELATNAFKHGSLSAKGGRVTISWRIDNDTEEPARISLTWQESNGPPVKPATNRGFGSQIIEYHITSVFGGNVDIRHENGGLSWHLDSPLQALTGKPEAERDADINKREASN